MIVKKNALIAAILATTAVASAQAYQTGDIIVRAGVVTIDPNISSGYVSAGGINMGSKVDSDRDTQFGLARTYMLSEHLGVGLLLAMSFTHTFKTTDALASQGHIAEVKQLLPTLTLQYYFNTSSSRLQPYVGAGINYNHFFDEHIVGVNANNLSGLSVDDSWGLAGQVGLDFDLGNNWNINTEVSYDKINTTAKLKDNKGVKYKANIYLDSWIYMVGIGYTF